MQISIWKITTHWQIPQLQSTKIITYFSQGMATLSFPFLWMMKECYLQYSRNSTCSLIDCWSKKQPSIYGSALFISTNLINQYKRGSHVNKYNANEYGAHKALFVYKFILHARLIWGSKTISSRNNEMIMNDDLSIRLNCNRLKIWVSLNLGLKSPS